MPDSAGEEPTFEAALAELQNVVRILEEGDLGLDESIARFERGVSLLRRLYQALERAEQKIEILTGFDRSGNPLTTPFDSEATLEASQASPGKRRKASAKKNEPDAGAEPSLTDEESRGPQLF